MLHEQALALAIGANENTALSVATDDVFLVDTTGTFVNQLGSTATLNFGANGQLTGTYTSNVSSGGGTISGPITGWYDGWTIAWSVNWPTKTPAITSWTGQYIQNGSAFTIQTLWYMVTQTANPGDPTQFWTAVNAGTDTFTPQ